MVLAQVYDECPETDAELIKEAEGLKQYRYFDKKDIPRICYGQRLDDGRILGKIWKDLGKDYFQVKNGTLPLSEADCDILMQADLEKARRCGTLINSECSCF